MEKTMTILKIIKLVIYILFGIYLFIDFGGHITWTQINNILPATSTVEVEEINLMITRRLLYLGIFVVIIEIIITTIEVIRDCNRGKS